MYGLTAEYVNKRSSRADWNPTSTLKKCKAHINILLQSQICWFGLPVSFSSLCPDELSTNRPRIWAICKLASPSLHMEIIGFNVRSLCLLLSLNSFAGTERDSIPVTLLAKLWGFLYPSIIPMFLCREIKRMCLWHLLLQLSRLWPNTSQGLKH